MRFEYKRLRGELREGGQGWSGEDVPSSYAPVTVADLDKMGWEGWEAVSVEWEDGRMASVLMKRKLPY
jgi:hypothetical protein